MNTKWKVMTIMMMIIITICLIYTAIVYMNGKNYSRQLISSKIDGVRGITRAIQEELSKRYRTRTNTFVDYRTRKSQEDIIEAFATRDREKLISLSEPFLKILRKENPYFSTFSWLTNDNYNFLRVHRPDQYADFIGKMRPDIVEANQKKQAYDNFMVSKTGLQYRIVQPVEYKGKHVGLIQFGIKSTQILDSIYEKLKLPIGIAIPNEKYKFIKYSKLPAKSGAEYTIQSNHLDILAQGFDRIDWNQDVQEVTLGEKTYIIANAYNLLNYKSEKQGYVFIALDISDQHDFLQHELISISIICGILVIFSFLILNYSYDHLVKKIAILNKQLELHNQNLEKTVDERTAELKQALSEVKTLKGILPTCSYCKKIRNETGEWEEIDHYIHKHSDANISHGICPTCEASVRKQYGFKPLKNVDIRHDS